jgi:hypothetical protein
VIVVGCKPTDTLERACEGIYVGITKAWTDKTDYFSETSLASEIFPCVELSTW